MDVIDENEYAAREDEEHGDDTQGTDGVETDEEVCELCLFVSGGARRNVWYSHARGGSMVFADGILQKITQKMLLEVMTENRGLRAARNGFERVSSRCVVEGDSRKRCPST